MLRTAVICEHEAESYEHRTKENYKNLYEQKEIEREIEHLAKNGAS